MITVLQDLLQHVVRILIVNELLEIFVGESFLFELIKTQHLIEESFLLTLFYVHIESILYESRTLGIDRAFNRLILHHVQREVLGHIHVLRFLSSTRLLLFGAPIFTATLILHMQPHDAVDVLNSILTLFRSLASLLVLCCSRRLGFVSAICNERRRGGELRACRTTW